MKGTRAGPFWGLLGPRSSGSCHPAVGKCMQPPHPWRPPAPMPLPWPGKAEMLMRLTQTRCGELCSGRRATRQPQADDTPSAPASLLPDEQQVTVWCHKRASVVGGLRSRPFTVF